MKMLSGEKAFFGSDLSPAVRQLHPRHAYALSDVDQRAYQVTIDYAGYPEIIASQLAELDLERTRFQQTQAQQSGEIAVRSMVDRVA